MTTYTVEAKGPRFRIGWDDADAQHWIIVDAEGEEITKIHTAGSGSSPAVCNRKKDRTATRGPSSGMSYESAASPAWADTIADIREQVRDGKLISKAVRAAKLAEAEAGAREVELKAQAVIRVLIRHGIAEAGPLGRIAPKQLAAVYDDIQNSAAW
jgi:hypothetical protein